MRRTAVMGLAGLMVGAGIGHAVAPAYFRGLVPAWVPAPGAVVAVSGLCDVVAGALVAVPATRTAGGWLTAGLITAYLPAHLDPLRRASTATRFSDRLPGIAARGLVNLGYVGWAVAVARGSSGSGRTLPTSRAAALG